MNKAIEEFRKGNPVIVTDDKNRENEADIIYSAEYITQEKIVFMLQHTSGIICVPCLSPRLQALNIPAMVKKNTSRHGCAFTLSVDAKNTSTGVSAEDRLATISALADMRSTADDFIKPGHVFPLEAKEDGVLERQGHTEAAIDLCRLAGLQPVAVLAELMNPDGTMMQYPELSVFAEKHAIPIVAIKEMIAFLEKPLVQVHLPTKYGDFTVHSFESNGTHLALVKGNAKENALVRIHSECLTGDVFGSKRCDCGEQLHAALEMIKEQDGILLYLRQEGRGIGITNKLRAYHLQERGYDTVSANLQLGFPADPRDYSIAATILKRLGIRSIRLITNNPKKMQALEKEGIKTERVPLEVQPNEYNVKYLKVKKEKLGHLLCENY